MTGNDILPVIRTRPQRQEQPQQQHRYVFKQKTLMNEFVAMNDKGRRKQETWCLSGDSGDETIYFRGLVKILSLDRFLKF